LKHVRNMIEWNMKKDNFQAFLYQLWLGINHSSFALEATKISISDGFGHTLKIWKVFGVHFFINYFHFFHMPYYPLWFLFIFLKDY
jgi:hypothetical protein